MNDELHNKVVKFFYDHEELFIAIMNKTPYQSDGWDYEIEVVKEFLTANQSCYCGDIYNLGVIHRDDGPCHYPNDKEPEPEPVAKYCCHLCFNKSGQLFLDRMIVCPECGNKRCPKATHHELLCTNSNESNQAGSVYITPPQRKPLTDEQMCNIAEQCGCMSADWIDFARAIEAAHGIKE